MSTSETDFVAIIRERTLRSGILTVFPGISTESPFYKDLFAKAKALVPDGEKKISEEKAKEIAAGLRRNIEAEVALPNEEQDPARAMVLAEFNAYNAARQEIHRTKTVPAMQAALEHAFPYLQHDSEFRALLTARMEHDYNSQPKASLRQLAQDLRDAFIAHKRAAHTTDDFRPLVEAFGDYLQMEGEARQNDSKLLHHLGFKSSADQNPRYWPDRVANIRHKRRHQDAAQVLTGDWGTTFTPVEHSELKQAIAANTLDALSWGEGQAIHVDMGLATMHSDIVVERKSVEGAATHYAIWPASHWYPENAGIPLHERGLEDAISKATHHASQKPREPEAQLGAILDGVAAAKISGTYTGGHGKTHLGSPAAWRGQAR